MEAHIQRNELLTVFQSGFRRHHSTTTAVLKVTEDTRSNMEDKQVTVLVLWVFLNERLTATDHMRKVCQKIYWILHSLRPHAAHTPFEVRRRLVLSFILLHVNYGNIVFTGADSASQLGLGIAFKACLRYIHMRRRVDHVSHLESTVTGTLLNDNARIQLLSFSYKILHVRHPSYLFSLFHFASSAHTRNLTVPPHRTLAMSQSFVVLGCRACNFLPHDVKRLLTHGRFVSTLRGMYRSP
jgi:hypothetical protein